MQFCTDGRDALGRLFRLALSAAGPADAGGGALSSGVPSAFFFFWLASSASSPPATTIPPMISPVLGPLSLSGFGPGSGARLA